MKNIIKKIGKRIRIFKKISICIDCGENFGGIKGKIDNTSYEIYSFEQLRYVFKILGERFKNNNKAHCINKCVWDEKMDKWGGVSHKILIRLDK